MVDSENEEMVEIHSRSDPIDYENYRPESSLSATISSTLCQSLGNFGGNNIAGMEPIIDVCLASIELSFFLVLFFLV